MNKRKIALVYDAIYPYIKGGGEKRFYELGKRLVNRNTEVHLYGMKFWDGPNVIKKDGMYLHGIMKARPLYNKDGNRTISQAILFGLACFKLIGQKFDVMDCCGFPYFSLFSCKLVTILKGKPLYASWYEVWGKDYWKEYLGTAGFFGYWIELFAAKLPNIIIACSTHTAQLLRSRLNVKKDIIVVPNGIAINKMLSIKPSKEKSDITFAGRLMDYKNIDLIIKAIALLNGSGVILSCKIIGEGPNKKHLQNLAKKLNVENQIHWLGFLEKSSDVYAHMKSSKVFVLPSKREGFGTVVIEANACGIPVLTTKYVANAAKDLIKHGVNGFVFEPNTKDLVSKITKILEKPIDFKQASLNFALDYDWSSLTKKVSEVYSL